MIKRNKVQVAAIGLLLSSAMHAGVPQLTVGIGFLMAGGVTGNLAWESYKSSRSIWHQALDDFRQKTGTAKPPVPVPHINDAIDPYMKNPLAVIVYNYYLNHPQACQYGAASALCFGIGVHLVQKEFKDKKRHRHHHRHDD